MSARSLAAGRLDEAAGLQLVRAEASRSARRDARGPIAVRRRTPRRRARCGAGRRRLACRDARLGAHVSQRHDGLADDAVRCRCAVADSSRGGGRQSIGARACRGNGRSGVQREAPGGARRRAGIGAALRHRRPDPPPAAGCGYHACGPRACARVALMGDGGHAGARPASLPDRFKRTCFRRDLRVQRTRPSGGCADGRRNVLGAPRTCRCCMPATWKW